MLRGLLHRNFITKSAHVEIIMVSSITSGIRDRWRDCPSSTSSKRLVLAERELPGTSGDAGAATTGHLLLMRHEPPVGFGKSVQLLHSTGPEEANKEGKQPPHPHCKYLVGRLVLNFGVPC